MTHYSVKDGLDRDAQEVPSGLTTLEVESLHARPESVTLVVSSFDNLASLIDFCRLIERLPGVIDTNPRQFKNGILALAVECSPGANPADALMSLFPSNIRLRSIVKGIVEIAIVDEGSEVGE